MNPTINGRLFRDMVLEAAYMIDKNRQKLNDLNVFPVPDGDTGTNMGLTITAAARAVEARDPSLALTEAADCTAMALLRGARGNSGVILSLLFRGIAKEVKGLTECDGAVLARALVTASETAYRAVMKPTEGTILTVARVSAADAQELAQSETNATAVLAKAFASAQVALKGTTAQNPVLARAGVVDAGGAGWTLVLSAMLAVARGEGHQKSGSASGSGSASASGSASVSGSASTDASAAAKGNSAEASASSVSTSASVPQNAQSAFSTEEIKFAYCTEFIVNRTNTREPGILRGFLEGIGDCVVVVDDEEIIKVHVHTNHPGQAIEEALTFGSLDALKIENMRIQHTEKLLSGANTAKSATETVTKSTDSSDNSNGNNNGNDSGNGNADTSDFIIPDGEKPAVPQDSVPAEKLPAAFVAVVSGEGLANVFRDLGVQELVEGGQTMNPSTIDICEAAERAPSDTVFILPNNKNIIMAAQQAAPLTEKTLIVLPTVSIPQGISAMLAYDAEADAETNRVTMEEAFANTHTAMLTYAARDSVLDDRTIREGDYLALVDGKLVNTASREEDVLNDLAQDLTRFEGISYISIFYGAGMDETAAKNVEKQLQNRFPDAEISILDGGQPIYYYIISLE